MPKGTVSFQGFLENPGGQRHQAGFATVFAEIDVGEVAFDAEIRVVDPVGAAQTQGDFLEALAEYRHHMQAAAKVGDKGAEGQRRFTFAGIKEIDPANMHRGRFRFQVQERGIQFR